MRKTNLKDKNGRVINDGDLVSLDGIITADDSMGELPNGWVFDEGDVYRVYFDERIENWSLELGVEPDSDENCKYMSHAVHQLHNAAVVVVAADNPK